MKVNRIKLLNNLEKVAPAVSSSSLKPEHQFFRFSSDGIQSSNGIISIFVPFSGTFDGTFGIRGSQLLSLLRSLESEEVEFVFKEDKLQVKTNRIEGTFAIARELELVPLPIVKEEVTKEFDALDLSNIVEGLSICRASTSKDTTSGGICGVIIKKDVLLSTDTHRIMKWNLSRPLLFTKEFESSAPVEFIELVLKRRSELTEFSISSLGEFMAKFNDDSIICTKTYEKDYPNLLEFFPKSEFVKFEFSKDLTTSIERHVKFLSSIEGINKEISIKYDGKKCILNSIDKELGSLSEEVEILNGIESALEFSINPVFLTGAAGLCSGFKYFKEANLIMFETDDFQYMVMLRV